MPYQHLSAPYELSVTDHYTIWLDRCDNLKNRILSMPHIFLMNWDKLEPAGHIPTFVAESFVECNHADS